MSTVLPVALLVTCLKTASRCIGRTAFAAALGGETKGEGCQFAQIDSASPFGTEQEMVLLWHIFCGLPVADLLGSLTRRNAKSAV